MSRMKWHRLERPKCAIAIPCRVVFIPVLAFRISFPVLLVARPKTSTRADISSVAGAIDGASYSGQNLTLGVPRLRSISTQSGPFAAWPQWAHASCVSAFRGAD